MFRLIFDGIVRTKIYLWSFYESCKNLDANIFFANTEGKQLYT